MAITLVQTQVGTASAGSAATAAFGSNVTAGNLIVVFISHLIAAAGTFTVTDGLGNTYVEAVRSASAGTFGLSCKCSIWYAYNISGGACTVTVSNAEFELRSVIAHEYHSDVASFTADPLDVTGSSVNDTNDPILIALTTTADGLIIIGKGNANGNVDIDPIANYPLAVNYDAGDCDTFHRLAATAGSNSPGFENTPANGDFFVAAAAFKEPTSGGFSVARHRTNAGAGASGGGGFALSNAGQGVV